jgi:hypothetical protein
MRIEHGDERKPTVVQTESLAVFGRGRRALSEKDRLAYDGQALAPEDLVVAAHPITLKIQGYVSEPVPLAGAGDGVALFEGSRELGLADLDARHGSLALARDFVPADAYLLESEGAEVRLERGDLREARARDARTIGKPARETSRSGLVPHAEPKQGGHPPDVVFSKLRLDERTAHTGALGRFDARAVVAEVVHIRAVDDVGEPPERTLFRGQSIELGLAMKTSVGLVGDVALVIDLVRFDELVPGTDLLSDLDGELSFRRGEAGAHGGHRDCPVAEDAMSNGKNEGAVDSP